MKEEVCVDYFLLFFESVSCGELVADSFFHSKGLNRVREGIEGELRKERGER